MGRRTGSVARKRFEPVLGRAGAWLLCASALAGTAAPAHAQVAELLPVDEAVRDPDLFVLRARLIEAVATRDTVPIYAVLAPDILNSFGGNGGIDEFKEMWRPGAADSELWPVLARVLALGGAFLDDTMFMAPYPAARFPPGLDAFMHVAIVGVAPVHEQPAASAPVLDTLRFAVVPAQSSPGDGEWLRITLADGRSGYVAERMTSSAIGYRAGFVKRDGRWLLRVLVAGD